MNDDDDHTFLDRIQDLGAWMFVLGVPVFIIAIITYVLGAY